MRTTVVNKYHNRLKTPNDTYIGRGSDWGNIFSHLDAGGTAKCDTRDEACDKHLAWIFTQRHLLARLKELKGRILVCYCHPARCHGHTLAQLADTTWWKDDKIILECSSKGDMRFSAFGAEVEMFGKTAVIEEHYQLCKRFGDFTPTSIYDIKGKNRKVDPDKLTHINILGVDLPSEFREEFYKLLWLKYLDEHPELVAYARHFDDYNDIFKGKSLCCQSDCIRQYIQQGRESIVDDISILYNILGEII